MAKLVARLVVPASFLGSNPDILQTIINGRHQQSSGQHSLSRKKCPKNCYTNMNDQLNVFKLEEGIGVLVEILELEHRCAAHAIFCCKVNRSLFGRCCI